MLLETTKALHNLLNGINTDDKVVNVCMDEVKSKLGQDAIQILMAEKYRELIAIDEKSKEQKIRYPIIVIHDGDNIEYDSSRFYNDYVHGEPYEATYKGDKVIREDEYEPYMPYNLNYRIEIVCKQRKHLDAILYWIMLYIPDRGCLDVQFVDVNGNDEVYNSLLKRGPIIKADEGTSSVLYRRIFELRLTTLLDGKLDKTYTKAEVLSLEEKGDVNDV